VARLCGARGWAIVVVGIATCCGLSPAQAADQGGFVPAYATSQVMLYVSFSFAAHNSHSEAIGFRFERSSPASSDPAARFCAPLAHHSLIDLQFARGTGPRMQFGPRVTWDIGHGRLAPTSLVHTWPLTMQLAMPTALPTWAP